jgi:hypothetical protein
LAYEHKIISSFDKSEEIFKSIKKKKSFIAADVFEAVESEENGKRILKVSRIFTSNGKRWKMLIVRAGKDDSTDTVARYALLDSSKIRKEMYDSIVESVSKQGEQVWGAAMLYGSLRDSKGHSELPQESKAVSLISDKMMSTDDFDDIVDYVRKGKYLS